MTYIDNIKELGSPSLDEIIKNAYNNLSGNRRRTPWIGLSHGVDLLKNADDLNQYLCAYGKMHQEKLNLAFKYIDDYLWGTTEISIVDYSCGQGLASIALADFMHQHKYSVDCIKEIILIEPSRLCLKRAESYVRSVYPKTDVKVLNKDINNLTPDDILSSSSLTIHLFSNILDIESLNLKRLSTVINISRDFDKSHVFVCVGPYFGLRHKDQRLQYFCSDLYSTNRSFKELHFAKGEWKNDWSCSFVVKQSISNSLIVHKYLKGAIDGDSISQFELGKCYLKGNGIEQNLQQAIYWLVQAATQGHLNAEIELALYYSEGLYDKPDYNQTIFWYSKAAKTSNWAKECLGDLYYYGIGVEKDLEKAVSYYRSSIENRFDSITRVNNDLMVLLAEKEKKQNELIENIKKAEMSDINALINLFDFYAEPSQFTNYRKAYQFYEKAAELGDVEAQAEIAYSYLIGKGKRWIKDSTNAFKWLKMASNQNQNFALYTLGQCYEHGIEIQKNITEAVKYYKLSAQHGNIEAQMKLGDLFFYGLKVIRDYNEAFKWYKLACDNQGEYPNPEPFYKVGYCLFYGLGCDEDKETAVYYLASCLNMESTYYKCLPLLHEYCKSNPELLGDLYSKDIWDCTELDVVLNDYKDYLFSFEY